MKCGMFSQPTFHLIHTALGKTDTFGVTGRVGRGAGTGCEGRAGSGFQ
jgi:hypothetical protein